ncbi:MAG: hydrolase [Burkholderiales bacterium PBB4]|nr:MAG: hydrolase [Burkholderiales bacterium PBB4]
MLTLLTPAWNCAKASPRRIVATGICLHAVFGAAWAGHQSPGLVGPEASLPAFHAQLRENLGFSLGWNPAHQAHPAAWRLAGLEKARSLILQPGTDTTPFAPTVVREQDRGSYVAQEIEFNVSAQSRVRALMLVPKASGPFPAVLALHDHGARFDIGKEKLVAPWGDSSREASAHQWSDKYFSGRFPGDVLAQRGYVVLAVDALGWGDRSAPGFQASSQQALAANLMNLGTSFASLIATEDVRAARFLASHPLVAPGRVAAVGFSMGAFRAWQVAALSDDVAAAVAVCWMATTQGLMVPGNNQLKGQSAFAMLHPYLVRYLDYPDVAALAAPKPLLFYAGERDPLMPVDSVRQAFGKMQAVWTAMGAPGHLHTRVWASGHVFEKEQQEAAWDWLETALRPGAGPSSLLQNK